MQDIKVPGLAIDWERLELRLEWRTLIVQFMSEENKARDRFDQKLRQEKANVLEMRAQIDAGKLDEMEAFSRLLHAAGDAHHAAYTESRAERLGHHDLCGDEKLKKIRFELGFRGGDDGEDGGSDDEWVTDEEDSGEDSNDEVDCDEDEGSSDEEETAIGAS
jgi:hypothetical protein